MNLIKKSFDEKKEVNIKIYCTKEAVEESKVDKRMQGEGT